MSKFGIQRYKTSLTILSGTTNIVSASLALNGLLRGISISAPVMTGASFTVTIKDADGFTVYNKASIAPNALTSAYVDANNQPLQLPLSGGYTITLLSAGTEAADRAFGVALLIDRG
ncbi:hypothetical protein SAMN04487914_10891 [Arthrobacter sp. ok909]|uniref:hypothetical protein n=1 Tax=Arthrobacter sp. ok909 TaxID=1761746 RepID=UPI000883AA8F|nr:hypothetical protein [Arthrobacter sp. ok909]SDP33275.1 hypothetical protein SAMN04487914_10891 [Arthrobacter sp. ok909]